APPLASAAVFCARRTSTVGIAPNRAAQMVIVNAAARIFFMLGSSPGLDVRRRRYHSPGPSFLPGIVGCPFALDRSTTAFDVDNARRGLVGGTDRSIGDGFPGFP